MTSVFGEKVKSDRLLLRLRSRGGHKWIETHQKERDSKSIQEWDCIFDESLKDLFGITHTDKIHLSFFGVHLIKTPKLSMLDLEQ